MPTQQDEADARVDAKMAAQLETIAANHGGEVLGGVDRFGKLLKLASQISWSIFGRGLGLGLAGLGIVFDFSVQSFAELAAWLESFGRTNGARTGSLQKSFGWLGFSSRPRELQQCFVRHQVQEFRIPRHTSITQIKTKNYVFREVPIHGRLFLQ